MLGVRGLGTQHPGVGRTPRFPPAGSAAPLAGAVPVRMLGALPAAQRLHAGHPPVSAGSPASAPAPLGDPPEGLSGTAPATPDGRPLPRLRDRDVLAVLAFALILLAVSWSQLAGYQLADSVEYMERAQAVVRGVEVIDSSAVRSFGYTGLLLPIFAAAEWLGLTDLRWLPYAARLVQIAVSLALVLATIRLGARLGGRSMGLAAGVALSANAVFLRWGVSPLSDVAAALGVLLGLSTLVDRGPPRRAFVAGLWLGASLLMAFKVVLAILAILVPVALRDARGHRRHLAALLAGVGAMALLQCLLDWAYYGTFGISLGNYLLANFAGTLGPMIHKVGEATGIDAFKEIGYSIYNMTVEAVDRAYQQEVGQIRRLRGADWYVLNLRELLPVPAILMLALGVATALRHLTWRWTLLLGLVLIDALVLSFKGSKEFRLWLPILPAVCVLVGQGWAWVGGHLPNQDPGCVRRAAATGLLLATCVLGARANAQINRRTYGVFWEAMDVVDRAAEKRGEDGAGDAEPLRVASSYHWAVFLRESPAVELVKLPHQLHLWQRYEPEERAEDLAALGELDWFVTHLALLTDPDHADLLAAVNERFAVHTVLHHRDSVEAVGAVMVMRRRTGAPGERTLFDVRPVADREAYRREHRLGLARHFGRFGPLGIDPELVLLGWEYEELPREPGCRSDGHGWITYHWAGGPFDRDFTVVDRLLAPDERAAWYNNHQPAHGTAPTSSWTGGEVVREGYPVIAEADPFRADVARRPLGGSYRRGDLVPLSLWMDVVAYDVDPRERGADDPEPRVVDHLLPFRPRDGVPVHELAPPGAFYSPDGFRMSRDSMSLVGRFLLPIRDENRVPDDGRPVPADG